MSGHNAPSPAPRSASTGPNVSLPTPTSTAMVNGVTGGNPTQSNAAPSTNASATTQQMSQQNLNQIVIDYLAKKGYTKTEAVLRAESANQEIPKEFDPRPAATSAPRYFEMFSRLTTWAEDTLDVYKPEIQRALWPIFVYSYLNLVQQFYPKEANRFCTKFGDLFKKDHEYDLRSLERISLPEHTGDDNIAKLYRENKYRLTISTAAFWHLLQFFESISRDGFVLAIKIIQDNIDLREVDRALDDRYSFASIIARGYLGEEAPQEEDGIPGHKPGNAISSTDPNVGKNLATLKLGRMPMEKELEEDVRAEVMDLDLAIPAPDHSLLQTHEVLNIKQEDEDEGPNRADIPYPPSTARDVAMEVTKIREHRDRVKIESRTGGIGPGLSVVMYTWHNTHDKVNCLDFSGDYRLVAAGTMDSYIRVWTLDGSQLGEPVGGVPTNSRKLIGHQAPVYDVAFAPASYKMKDVPVDADTEVKWLLSCGGDGTIRLWNLDTFTMIVNYKGHVGPVWSIAWGPFGHYFISGGHDKTARIWMTDKVRVVRFLAGHDNCVDVTCFHPNSAYVFTASLDKTVRMWSMNNGNAVRMFTGHTSPITAMACSPNGKFLATADDSGTILIWDLAPGRLLKKMRGHGKGGIWSLSWSVESTVLVSGGADNTVRSWDVAGPAKEANPAKPGEPSKPDGTAATTTSVGVNLATGGVAKKGRKDAVVTADQISAFLTKNSPVYKVKFTNMNLVLAGGAFLPEQSK